MKLKNIACLAIGVTLLSQSVLAANETVTYKNERGSILKLQFNSDNTVTGSFTTAVASKECQQAIGMKRPLVGFTAKNSITFSVNYPDCGAVLTFIGNVEDGKKLIDTTAMVAHPTVHIEKEGPGARMISHDVFNQI